MKLANQHLEEAITKKVLNIEEIQDDHPDFLLLYSAIVEEY